MKSKDSKKLLNALRKKLVSKINKEKTGYEKLAAIDKSKPIVRQLVQDRLKHMGMNLNGIDDGGNFEQLHVQLKEDKI